jgi:hypothetical protein
MADEQGVPAAAVAANANRGTVIRIAKAEEGSAKGEFWAVLRAVIFLVCGILVLGYLIG